jgi:dTDP-glucose 4,6-dehydratase
MNNALKIKILVTGGAGFIGSEFVNLLLNKYPIFEIYVIDSLTYSANLERIDIFRRYKNFFFIKGDISDAEFIDSIFKIHHFTHVVNFAAESHVDKSILDSYSFIKTNVNGVHVLLEACLKYHVKRFHQVSTDEVYGDLPIDNKNIQFKEDSLLKPSSPYSASKASADLLTLAYHRTHNLDVTISRCSNNYGPYQFPEKLIPLTIRKALNNELIPIYGNGLNIRDWLHVKDHCSAIDLILHNGSNGHIYNIGGNNERSNIEVVNFILSVLEKPQTLLNFVSDRKGHDLRYSVNYSKINKELNWSPKIPFDTGFKNTIFWYLANSNWAK